MLRIANCSGFYGDRLSAAREMVEGGPIDVLTGDWLAELTMLILAGNRLKGRPGYAPTFLKQLEEVLGTCLERGIKIVSNAGGLDPEGCALAVRDLAARLGLTVKVAHITGDDLTGRDASLIGDLVNADTGERLDATPLTANAYLGGFPIATALSAGADVVVTGRVTDAALVTGPGIWRYGWRPGDLDALAGSVVAGHVIECGCQATGGNYAFFEEVPDLAHCGFPIAELHADGSSVITKHPGTGGLVSVGTVTAQLLYEIASPRYPGPDVVARFDTITLAQEGPDRVRVCGVRGEPPPGTLKAAVTFLGGYRNTMTLVLTGLDIEAKARAAQEAIWARVPRESFDEVHVTLDPPLLRITVMDADRAKAGRAFSSAVVETGLASYPGFYGLTPPGDASPYGIYWPVLVPALDVRPRVFLDGEEISPADPPPTPETPPPSPAGPEGLGPTASSPAPGRREGVRRGPAPLDGGRPTVRAPLGRVLGARSGDKGGNANLGVWVRTAEHYPWLESFLTVERLKDLLPSLRPHRIDRYELPNLNALNFVVHGLLGRGVAASPRLDPQAKALGEELRAQAAEIPEAVLPREPPAAPAHLPAS
ncbi:acyclic terpene utilization AtuA family protein [Thermoactinospora rubra]|uniref:acyclic terpene utilization AtuA family protein n=1 Tax=Thermoactinospora rubra TaxID=1088767 RepID=UPI000A0FB3C7|nr:acyclic terpene utilization AtuA family protein [Thermoactinospora rubra]